MENTVSKVQENVIVVNENSIKTEKAIGKISVDEILTSEYQKEGTVTAQLRQIISITSHYPSKRVTNNMQDNLFDVEEFGFTTNQYVNTENRVCWLDVPTNTTVEALLKKIEQNPEACLYKVMSNKPILTDTQEYAIKAGIRTYDEFANAQVVRYPEGTKLKLTADSEEETDVSGQIVLDKNQKVQYRRIFFSKTAKADLDYRTEKENDVYMSDDIKTELLGAAANVKQVI